MGIERYLDGQSQFQFSSEPPANSGPSKFDLVRTPPKGRFKGTIIGEIIVGHRVHYWNGSTQPCINKPCEACNANRRAEWKGWVWVCEETALQPFVFEFPTSGGRAFTKIRARYGVLRGLRIETYRKTKRGNGPIGIDVLADRADVYKLPQPGDTLRFLSTLWRCDIPQIGGRGIDPDQSMTEGEIAVAEKDLDFLPTRTRLAGLHDTAALFGDRVANLRGEKVNGVPHD